MTLAEQSTTEIKWWKDKKLLAGVILVILSIVLGFYGKGLFIIKFYEPVYLITGLSIWAFSWVLLFLGVFLVGWETVKMIQQRIHHHVRKTVKTTYHYTKGLPKKSYDYTKELQREGMSKIAKSSKVIIKKIRR
ncbi:hypothetical protein HYX03_03055 [Candidatus Woesearchaeota archaeon]|nr:hypothetical protein [Candidatus Woesearchaeota archaeon]